MSGADTNVSAWLITEYDLVVDPSLGCCVTPSSVTKTSWLEGTSFERLNIVVDPSPVKLSIVLSSISKLAATSPMKVANTLSVATGAVLNTIVESASTP